MIAICPVVLGSFQVETKAKLSLSQIFISPKSDGLTQYSKMYEQEMGSRNVDVATDDIYAISPSKFEALW